MTPAQPDRRRRHCRFPTNSKNVVGGARRQSDIKSDRQTWEEERDILHAHADDAKWGMRDEYGDDDDYENSNGFQGLSNRFVS